MCTAPPSGEKYFILAVALKEEYTEALLAEVVEKEYFYHVITSKYITAKYMYFIRWAI